MKKYIKIILAVIVLVGTASCEPRVDLDYGQWGDKAFITNVQLFAQEIKDDFQLAEYYEEGQTTTGVRRVLMTGTSLNIDNDNFTVVITIPPGNDLSKAGILITHSSTLVEPLGSAPVAGTISDLSSRSFGYRLHSADGTMHDWTITIQE